MTRFKKAILLDTAHLARRFSLMVQDQSHEHSNRKIQADKEGLSDMDDDDDDDNDDDDDDDDAIALHMFACLDTVRLTDEFEKAQTLWDPSAELHEEPPSLAERFITDVSKFICVLRGNGNPYRETGDELVTIDTHAVMDHGVVMSSGQIAGVGKALPEAYVLKRVSQASAPIPCTIPRNDL